MRFTGASLTVLLLLLAATAFAAPLSRDQPVERAGMQRYTWYDGDQPRQAWLDPDVVAVFGDADQSAARTLRSMAIEATPLPSSTPGVQLWRLPQGGGSAVRSMQAAEAAAQMSPVLRDAADPDAPMRALPGQIIIHLNPNWPLAQAQAWIQSQELELLQQLDIGRNAFLLSAEPGLASLELANQLRLLPDIVAAMPNWWQELETR